MAFNKNSQMANRYGLNTKIYKYGEYTGGESDQAIMTINFANISEIALSGDTVWATGGQSHGNIVGFNNPLTGTFKLSTQIMTTELLALIAGQDIDTTTNTVVFENTASNTMPKYFTITSETVWQSKDGETFNEDLTFHKAIAKRALNISYNGDGDPVSVDIEFELAQDDNGKLLTIAKESATDPDATEGTEGQE